MLWAWQFPWPRALPPQTSPGLSGGNDLFITEVGIGNNPMPEPATMLLLGSGLVGLASLGRKKFFRK